MLAVSEDKDAAELMGVNVNATISLTFAIGSGLAAIAGALLCSAYPTLNPYTGSMKYWATTFVICSPQYSQVRVFFCFTNTFTDLHLGHSQK